ncbi:MAG: hypothetical protein J5601_02105 [Elusimicrobiaceae bacterium]|nr:hypothetical protein [Elusimicrobiaceae bacterium]
MKKIKIGLQVLGHWLDPYKQSFFYFDMDWLDWLVFLSVSFFLLLNRKNIIVAIVVCNPFILIYNFYMALFFGTFPVDVLEALFVPVFGEFYSGWLLLKIFSYFLFPFFMPLGGILFSLRTGGGRWVLPVFVYWMGVTVTGLAPSFLHYPSPINWIGEMIMFVAICVEVLAGWSLIYYIRHQDQYPICYSEFF